MRIAFMILCHKNPGQVNRAIRALNMSYSAAQTDFYIHVSKLSQIKSQLMQSDNIFLVDDIDRQVVEWGRIGYMDAVFVLLRKVIVSGKKYDYVWLLSGQDYPIKPEKEIIRFLEENNGKNFINCMSLESDLYPRFLKRNMISYPRWIFGPSFLKRLVLRLYIILTGGTHSTFPFFIKPQLFKSDQKEKYYFGSSWFTITLDCAKYVINFIDNHPHFREFYVDACIPDEGFLQTIIFNSPYKDSTADYLCYLDWGQNKRNPSILTAEDFDRLVQSPYLVARKFDDEIDGKILDKLDAIKHS